MQVLMRFQNIFDKEEGGEDVLVSVDNLFTEFDVETLEETTLAANQPVKQNGIVAGLEFSLRPGQIRTFVANIIRK